MIATLIAIVALALQVIAAIVAGVWCVAGIRDSARELSGEVGHLSSEIGELRSTIEKIEARIWDHEVRLRVIEEPQRRDTYEHKDPPPLDPDTYIPG